MLKVTVSIVPGGHGAERQLGQGMAMTRESRKASSEEVHLVEALK